MPSIYETIKERITAAMKAQDQGRKDIYRFLKGKMDQLPKQDDEAATKIIRGLLKDAKEAPTQFSETDIKEMNSLVPALLDLDQTLELLDDGARKSIREAKADPQALGVAMKSLKGHPVDSEIVKTAVTHIRAKCELL